MRIFLWLLTAVLALIPLMMYLVYSLRRLETRRRLLVESLLTLDLADYYMKIRHGQSYSEWNTLSGPKRTSEMEEKYFNKDFERETSRIDYLWPVALMTALGGAGWYFALSRIYPDAGSERLNGMVPAIFVWGFVGAYMASLSSIIDEFRRYSLMPNSYYSYAYRLLFSSTAAYLAGILISTPESFPRLAAFGIGLFPVEQTWRFITEKTAKLAGVADGDGELGKDLAVIQGLEDSRNRRKLVDIGISSVQALATADPLFVFLQTTFPLRTVVDMIDKSILYLYIGDKVKELRMHGINGVIELAALVKLIEKDPAYLGATGGFREFFGQVDGDQLIKDVAGVLGQSDDELKAFIYNMYYDPVLVFIYDVWGRYLNAKPPEEEAPKQRAAGTG